MNQQIQVWDEQEKIDRILMKMSLIQEENEMLKKNQLCQHHLNYISTCWCWMYNDQVE